MDPWPFIESSSMQGGAPTHPPLHHHHHHYHHHHHHPLHLAPAEDASHSIAVSQHEKHILKQAFSRPFGEHHLTPFFIPAHHVPHAALGDAVALRSRRANTFGEATQPAADDADDAEVGDSASEVEVEVASPVARPPGLRRRNSWGSERDLARLRPSPSSDDLELMPSGAPAPLPMEPWRAFHEERISPSSKWIYCMHENGAILKVQVMAGMTGKYLVLEGYAAVETWRRLRGVANFERYFPEELRMDQRNPLFLKAEQQYQSCCGRWLLLPTECWKHGLTFLDGVSLAKAGMSCRMMGTAFEHSKIRESLVEQVSRQLLATYLNPTQLATAVKDPTKGAQLLAYLHKNCCRMPASSSSPAASGQSNRRCVKRWTGTVKFQHETVAVSLLESLALWDGEMQPLVLPELPNVKPQEELDVVPAGGRLFRLTAKRPALRAIVAALDNAGLVGHVLHHQCRLFLVTTAQLRHLVQQDGWEALRDQVAREYAVSITAEPVPTDLPAVWVLYFTPRQPGYYTWM